MSDERNERKMMIETPVLQRLSLSLLAALLTTLWTTSFAKENHENGNDKARTYQQINLVSDEAGVALLQDPNLVNAWGVSFNPTGPFWVSATETGLSTLYAVTNDSAGLPHVTKTALEVMIPGEGNPTGQVFNNTTNFNRDIFIFVSEDGTISGWRGALGNAAEVLTARPTAIYKGVTLAHVADETMLLAANFSEATVDVYDGDMNLIGQLSDPDAPAGYAPFNVQSIEGVIFVTYAKQDEEGEDDVPGVGHGLIDVLALDTATFHRFATGSDAGGRLRAIDSPWGVALAPSTFGKHAGQLLVGNFGSGTIMAFDEHGRFKGFLERKPGKPVVIEGLWTLTFGNGGNAGVPGTLYFTAGPDEETHGLLGSLEPVRKLKKQDNEDDHGDTH